MSNTSNTGLPDSASLPSLESDNPQTPRERAGAGLLLIGAAALIALALFAGFHAVSILYGVLFPPNPPMYEQMKLVSYESIDHGVDNWRYLSDSSPDQIASYYRDHGADCQVRSPGSAYLQDLRVGVTCQGKITFSIFSMNYEVVITPEQSTSVVRVSREVFWIGGPAAPTPNAP